MKCSHCGYDDHGTGSAHACAKFNQPVPIVAPLGTGMNAQIQMEKAAYWFDTLAKCARLLDLPDGEPIPSGVLRRVDELTKRPAQDELITALDGALRAFEITQGRTAYPADHWSNQARAALAKAIA